MFKDILIIYKAIQGIKQYVDKFRPRKNSKERKPQTTVAICYI